MTRRHAITLLLAAAVCAGCEGAVLPPTAAIVAAAAAPAPTSVNRDGTYGPFATMRRAEGVAQAFRDRGCRAVAFHNGDGYYVRATC